MAIKKRNKKSTKKSNNNKYNKTNNNKNAKQSSALNRNNSNDSSIDLTLTSATINGSTKSRPKTVTNGSTVAAVDVFGDSDKRLDLKTVENKTSNELAVEPKTDKPFVSAIHSAPKGLTNLGNTCYFNSVLQVMAETELLFDLLNDRSNDGYVYRAKGLKNANDWSADKPFDEELDIVLGQCLPLTQSLIGFMREMRSNNSRTISPTKMLRDLRRDWTQFEGWAQQDSHELLRCLLDSLKCKEVVRQKRAILSDFKSASTAAEVNNLDDDTKARIKSFATYAHQTPIDSVFGGQLLSTVCCDVCLHTNAIFEPFFDLSLPLTHLTNSFSNNSNNCVIIDNNKAKHKENKNTNGANGQQPIDNRLLEEDVKNLSPRERKQKRQLKKAVKREAKQQKKIVLNDEKPIINENTNNTNEVVTNGESNGPKIEDKTNKEEPEEGPKWWISTEPQIEAVPETADTKADESEDQSSDAIDDWAIEPLLDDWISDSYPSGVKALSSIDCKQYVSAECNGLAGDDDGFGLDVLYDNEEEEKSTGLTDGWNDYNDDWNENGWVSGPKGRIEARVDEPKPNFDWLPEPTATAPEATVDPELESDECKQQELELNSVLELEEELLMLNISDREKLELKQTTTEVTNNFDPNSSTIKRIITTCLETIGANESENLPNFDLMRLLLNFTSIDLLTGSNKYLCEMCTKANGTGKDKQLTNASKRTLIALPPPVLTLHLKRFEADGYRRAVSLRKISTFVSFPATFDLAPFVSKMYNYLTPITGHQTTNALIYSLYGVVEHSGSLRSGHYTAYVKLRPKRANVAKFAVLEPFVPKVENVLKMIEHKFFTDRAYAPEDHINGSNGLTNGATNGMNGSTAEDDGPIESDSGKWFHISDSSVSSSSLSSVLRSQAYILFYERIV